MNMPESARELIVFPTELSLRRFQQDQALEHGWVDASGHTTFARLRQLCLPYAKPKGRRMGPARELIMRKQAAEVARGHFVEGGLLGDLSEAALAGVLEKLIAELASLPDEADRIIDWMLNRSPKHKLYQLGMLYSVWRAAIRQEGFVDQLDINTAILRLLKGGRQHWPPLMRNAKKLSFRSVRWFNPFEEACVLALNQTMKIRIESALPPAHAEKAGERLGQLIRSEIMGQPWAVWTEDLGDALAVDSPDVLQLDDAARITFSRSAGAYGEIEDLARRIGWTIRTRDVPPARIALVVPDIGKVQDIIPHVFGRFEIPYYFRRGRPVLSSPCTKAFLAWLAFPLRPERDIWIDLIRNPAIRFDDREAAVEKLLNRKTPPRIDWQSLPYFRGMDTCSGRRAMSILEDRIVEPEDHFNREALNAAAAMLESCGEQEMPLRDLLDLLEELLEEATVRPRDSHDQGVWILNPRDAVGLDFDLVLFAGLNEGGFPGVPQQDALLNDAERYALRKTLEEQGRRLPALALPSADVLFEQESVLFLSSLGMARDQLVLSFQAVDQEGNEKGEGEYYRKLWTLAGWCAQDDIVLSSYDQWRIAQLGDNSVFLSHWQAQQQVDAEDRVPMPGESFLPVVPLPLCLARDEALQVAVNAGTTPSSSLDRGDAVPPAGVEHLVAMLKIEAERGCFLETPVGERAESVYCGHLAALKALIREWFEGKDELSPTALESLAQCRYVFLLERIIGLQDPRTADDTPDPMDRGGLIHEILFAIYSALADGTAEIDAPRFWAVETASGWKKRSEPGMDAVPLVTFLPELERQYLDFAVSTAKRVIGQAVAEGRMLGHPGVWAAEQEKVLTMVGNFVRYDVQTAAAENRFPALFELQFGRVRGCTGVLPAVELGEDDDAVRLHGLIDRVDLLFDDAGALSELRVLDYKGPGRARSKSDDYRDEIRRNLDCQLPVYAFAAQQLFFGGCNTPVANAMTRAGYLFYQRDLKEIGKTLKKSLVALDEPGLADGFLKTLFENIRQLKAGDFAVDPLVEAYNDYQSVCRAEAVRREDLD
jgi:hypothetical protein